MLRGGWGKGWWCSEKTLQVRSLKAFFKDAVGQAGDGEKGSAGKGQAGDEEQGREMALRAGSVRFAFLGCGMDETKGYGTADNLRVTLSVPPSVGLEAREAPRWHGGTWAQRREGWSPLGLGW